mmetsp:Transcript_48163/g.145498  ORF Transcript_48163/g.145498 Transcript_48163/m.145498 type:complete len:135 (+) Transcript_48163:1338-1742(+)
MRSCRSAHLSRNAAQNSSLDLVDAADSSQSACLAAVLSAVREDRDARNRASRFFDLDSSVVAAISSSSTNLSAESVALPPINQCQQTDTECQSLPVVRLSGSDDVQTTSLIYNTEQSANAASTFGVVGVFVYEL